MGIATEGLIVKQTREAREEANQRLDKLIYEQQVTNYLLGQVLEHLRGEPASA